MSTSLKRLAGSPTGKQFFQGENVIIWRDDLTALTGGTSVALDKVPTVGRVLLEAVALNVGGQVFFFRLESGTDAENAPFVVRPDDYAAGTNEKVWRMFWVVGSTASTISAASPEGSYAAPTGTSIIANDGTFWAKVTGGAGNTGWRRYLILDENGNVNLALKFAPNEDPNLATGVIGLSALNQLLIGEDGLRRGHELDGWMKNFVKVDNAATVTGDFIRLEKSDLLLPSSFISSFADSTPFLVVLEYEICAQCAAPAGAVFKIGLYMDAGNNPLPATTGVGSFSAPATVLDDGFTRGRTVAGIVKSGGFVFSSVEGSTNTIEAGASILEVGGQSVGGPVGAFAVTDAAANANGLVMCPYIQLPGLAPAGQAYFLEIKTRWRIIEGYTQHYTP